MTYCTELSFVSILPFIIHLIYCLELIKLALRESIESGDDPCLVSTPSWIKARRAGSMIKRLGRPWENTTDKCIQSIAKSLHWLPSWWKPRSNAFFSPTDSYSLPHLSPVDDIYRKFKAILAFLFSTLSVSYIMSKSASLLGKLSLAYKTNRFPWKKHALVGYDLAGNEYWDCPNPLGKKKKKKKKKMLMVEKVEEWNVGYKWRRQKIMMPQYSIKTYYQVW